MDKLEAIEKFFIRGDNKSRVYRVQNKRKEDWNVFLMVDTYTYERFVYNIQNIITCLN